MPWAAVISRAVGRSANGWRRRSPASSRCCRSVTCALECDSRPVCCHIQRVHHLAVKILDVALRFRRALAGEGGRAVRPDAARGRGCRRSASVVRRSVPALASVRRSRCGRSPPRPPATAPSDPTPTGCPAPKARPPTVRRLTRRAGSSSSPWPARDRVLRRAASPGPAASLSASSSPTVRWSAADTGVRLPHQVGHLRPQAMQPGPGSRGGHAPQQLLSRP